MVRQYIRKTERCVYPDGHILKAVKEVVAEKKKVHVVAKETSIPKRSLLRYIKNFLAAGIQDEAELNTIIGGYKKHRRVFSHEQESNLRNYVKKASDNNHGFTTRDLRRLAYQYATREKCVVPLSWSVKQEAGRDWLFGFMTRQRDLLIRKPRATSVDRATSFNNLNIDFFFDNVEIIVARGIPPYRWFNAGFTTVHVPDGIIPPKGRKQIGSVTSGERDTLVTVCLAVCATGSSIPPFFVFPRVHFKEYFLHGAPLGSAGSANKSGLMSDKDFILFMNHFIQHVRPSKKSEVVLFLDNHSSHRSNEILNLAKDNGVVMFTIPPHCSHQLQPLDRSVFGPFKRYYDSYCSSWMNDNPGKPMSMHNIAELVGLAFPLATTPANITSGFKMAGLVPFNRFIFDGDVDSTPPSFVTDPPFNSTPVPSDDGFPEILASNDNIVLDGQTPVPANHITDNDLTSILPFNSTPIPSDDGFLEILASNDNIVQDGQTPVPANHITDNDLTAILPDLNDIVGIFEEDPLTIVQNVNISLDVQNGETFELRGVIEEDSNRNHVETLSPYPKAPSELTMKRGRGRPPKAASKAASNLTLKRGRGRPPKAASKAPSNLTLKRGRGRPPKAASKPSSKAPSNLTLKRGRGRPPKAASTSVLENNILTNQNLNTSSDTPPKENGHSDEMSIASVESRGDVENSEKENVTNDIQKKDVTSGARRGRGRPAKTSILPKTTVEKSPVAIVATRSTTRKTATLTPLDRRMKCCNVLLERDPEVEALRIAMIDEDEREKVDAATSQVEISVAARLTRGMLKLVSQSEPD